MNWHCLVQCSLTFSRQHLAAFPWQLGRSARVCLLKPLPWPLGMDDTTKLCSDRKLDPSLSLLPSTLDCIEPSFSAAKFGSTLLMATWQHSPPGQRPASILMFRSLLCFNLLNRYIVKILLLFPKVLCPTALWSSPSPPGPSLLSWAQCQE